MRELKFRAWNKKEQKMIYGVGVLGNIGVIADCIRDTLGGGILINPKSDRFILQQYTGLNDKNDKEIYEGDIVRNTFKPHTNYTSGSEVFFNYDGAWIMMGNSRIKLTELGELEVIGNVYESF